MPNERAPVEVFYSYAHEDAPLRDELEKHLSILHRQKLISSWHDRQIGAGTDWAQAIDTHLETASLILLLVSSDFLASDYCYSIEMNRALQRHHANEARVIPILLRPVDHWQSTPIGSLQVLPTGAVPVTKWADRDSAFADIAQSIRSALQDLQLHSAATPAHPSPSIWNIPSPRNPVFTGREAILQRIETQLHKGVATALSQAQAISGLGGIGKTQIAIEYAYRHVHEYEVVLWTLADSRESLISGYLTLAGLLNLPQKDEQDPTVIIQAVKHWLQTHNSWLLILDNADDLKLAYDFLPPTFAGHLLLTTRAQATGTRAERIAVDIMPQEVGALFLLHRAKLVALDTVLAGVDEASVALARSISKALDGLPLALDQAGAYIEETGCSLSHYLSRYQQERASLLERRGGVVPEHPDPVSATWSLSFRKVEEQSPTAANLLRLCAFLHPDGIPEEMIVRSATSLEVLQEKQEKTSGWLSGLIALLKRQGRVTQRPDRFVLDESVSALSAYSLIRRDPSDQTLSIHRLVQAVLRDTMDEPTRKLWTERAVQAVNEVFPEVEFATWAQCEQYLPHALVCAELVEEKKSVFPEAGDLLNRAGWYLSDRVRYSEAEPLIQQGLAIRQQCFEPVHGEIASSLGTLGYLYVAQGRFAEAEPVWQQALTIDEAVSGSEHREVATDLNNLAGLYEAHGKYEEAEPLYKRALTIHEQQLGEMHPLTATSLNNLAELYRAQGKYEEAEPLYKRAFSIYEQQLGEMHPLTATSLNNLAELYRVQGKYEEAEPLYKRALSIYEQQLGEMHPDTATSLNNLALLYDGQGKYEEAEPLYKRALSIDEKVYGLEHPDVARDLHNLATLYYAQGKYRDAEPLFKRALLIRQQALGLSHPLTQGTREWYIPLLRKTGREEEATALETRGQLPLEER